MSWAPAETGKEMARGREGDGGNGKEGEGEGKMGRKWVPPIFG